MARSSISTILPQSGGHVPLDSAAVKTAATYYSFEVRGRYPNGNTAKLSGHVSGLPGYPQAVFDRAVEACKELTPDLTVDENLRGQVTLRQLKGKPRR